MSDQKPTPEVNVEVVGQLAKAVLKNSGDAITGRRETNVLRMLVVVCRVVGVLILVCAIFQIWWFRPLAQGMTWGNDTSVFVVWLKVTGIGLLLGMTVYGIGEVILLLLKIEQHLSRIADKN